MENCDHQLRIDLFPQSGSAAQKHFWVAKCQKCHQVFAVQPTDNIENVLKSFVNDLMNITTQLAKIEGHLEAIAKKK